MDVLSDHEREAMERELRRTEAMLSGLHHETDAARERELRAREDELFHLLGVDLIARRATVADTARKVVHGRGAA